MTGIPFIIAAPSGAGKTSLVNALIASAPNLHLSTSYTSRPKRPAEKDGTDYFFISKQEFEELIAKGVFLEYAKVFGHYYGTSREWVEEQLAKGLDLIFEIDWQGSQQIKQQYQSCVSIFILPPSLQVLQERLEGRGQDKSSVIGDRMKKARNEISHYGEFDYLVINDSFERALEDLQAIVKSQRLLQEQQIHPLKELLSSLLA